MSPVVVVGFGALDAALLTQAIYAYRDLTRPERKQARRAREAGLGVARPAGFEPATSASGGRRSIH